MSVAVSVLPGVEPLTFTQLAPLREPAACPPSVTRRRSVDRDREALLAAWAARLVLPIVLPAPAPQSCPHAPGKSAGRYHEGVVIGLASGLGEVHSGCHLRARTVALRNTVLVSTPTLALNGRQGRRCVRGPISCVKANRHGSYSLRRITPGQAA